MRKKKLKDMREQILSDRGLLQQQRRKGQQKQLAHIPPSPKDDSKTPLMRLLELQHRHPIEELLMAGSLSVVSKRLGIDTSTISKWRKKLRLVYGEGNLPNCNGCLHKNKLCELGICNILYDMELYKLARLKYEEVINE